VSALPKPDPVNMKSLRKWILDNGTGRFAITGRGEQHTWGDLYKRGEAVEPSFWLHLGRIILALFWSNTDPDTKELDLVTPRPPENIDGFSRWVAVDFIPFWSACQARWREQKKKKADEENLEENLKEMSTTSKQRRRRNKKKINSPFNPDSMATYANANIVRFTSAVSTIVACLLPTVAIVVLSKVQGINHLLGCLAGIVVLFAAGLIFLTSGTVSRVEVFGVTAAYVVELLYLLVPH
jgi:hypothetical protein